MTKPAPPAVRCAVYTRKSSEEGLDQSFNSLHAQREACEAYVRSQAGQGWRLLPALYDDGGVSGGTLERPALQRLLADLAARRVDVVVVYKIDRLTRSLMDFAKLVDRFDAVGASFVSVTQAFNTTSSMGRLTLNVLLSFAQFEREVTGERIRDKIAASRAKGMWMGGVLPLGYDRPTDPVTRALIVNEQEAVHVQRIFHGYLEVGSVHRLAEKLAAEGVATKRQASGRGGIAFTRGALLHLLKNRVYLGEVLHRGETRAIGHPAIIDADMFAKVQARIQGQVRARVARPVRAGAGLLKGRIFDAEGSPMSPTFSQGRGGRVYGYYVSASLQTGRACAADDTLRRLSRPETDAFVLAAARRLRDRESAELVDLGLRRVDVLAEAVVLTLDLGDGSAAEALQRRLQDGERCAITDGGAAAQVRLPVRLKRRGGRSWVSAEGGRGPRASGKVDRVLVSALAGSHRILAEHDARPIGALDTLRQARAPVSSHHRRLAPLALLAPEIQQAICEGRQPRDLNLQRLLQTRLPLAWADQLALLGF